MVKRLKDGGQSINMFSYFEINLFFSFFRISFKINARLESLAVYTSRPERFTLDPIKSNPDTLLSCITSSRETLPINIL